MWAEHAAVGAYAKTARSRQLVVRETSLARGRHVA